MKKKTSDSASLYRLAESQAQKRLADFRESPNPGDLAESIALCKLLIEQSIANNQHVLTRDLLATLANLSKAHRIEQQRIGDLVSKVTARRLVSRYSEALITTMKEAFGDDGNWIFWVDRFNELCRVATSEAKDEVTE